VRSSRRWNDGVKMQLKDSGFEEVYWINVVQLRDQWLIPLYTVMDLRTRYNVRDFLTSCASISFSISTLLRGVRQGKL
jgi:hypothetical protein